MIARSRLVRPGLSITIDRFSRRVRLGTCQDCSQYSGGVDGRHLRRVEAAAGLRAKLGLHELAIDIHDRRQWDARHATQCLHKLSWGCHPAPFYQSDKILLSYSALS